MAQGSDGFCGDERGRFECLFLPWNRCPTRATVERLDGEAARRGDAKRQTATMLGPSNAYSGRFAVFGSAAASLCDKSTPLFARCPPHSSLCGDPPAPAPRCANVTRAFDLREAEPDERWDSERRLTLLHRALWDRPAWRLRNATAAEERAFYDRAPSFREAAAAGRCASVWKSNLQPDFNVRVIERFGPDSFAVLRELDESNRSVQKSAESTSI